MEAWLFADLLWIMLTSHSLGVRVHVGVSATGFRYHLEFNSLETGTAARLCYPDSPTGVESISIKILIYFSDVMLGFVILHFAWGYLCCVFKNVGTDRKNVSY